MRLTTPLTTARLLLRSLTGADVTERYIAWLKDPDVNRYLELRFGEHSIASTRALIGTLNDGTDTLMVGIFLEDSERHIGNIKLGPINPYHRRGEIGLLLGERGEWGKGYASEAIGALTAYGFDELRLKKITAGCYSENTGSLKAFLKVGYVLEGRLPEHWQTDTGPQDELLMGITAAQYAAVAASRTPRRYGHVDALTLIGGGDLLVHAAGCAVAAGYRVHVVMAPRHAAETLPLANENAERACRARGLDLSVIEDINAPGAVKGRSWTGPNTLALCFGPAWVFAEHVRAAFGAGMINVNGIPIPEYLGGAHYTWQILNGNRSGGCFLQEITGDLDRGDILRSERFELPASVRTPQDYFAENHKVGCRFIGAAIRDFRSNAEFVPAAFAQLDARRLYFPRLMTKTNGFIDWSWSGRDIERFCNAFDAPYMGAGTCWKGEEVRLSGVRLVDSDGASFHPYVSGLVVRKLGPRVWVAVVGGLLTVERIADGAGQNVIRKVREGQRLSTPQDILARAITAAAKVEPA